MSSPLAEFFKEETKAETALIVANTGFGLFSLNSFLNLDDAILREKGVDGFRFGFSFVSFNGCFSSEVEESLLGSKLAFFWLII